MKKTMTSAFALFVAMLLMSLTCLAPLLSVCASPSMLRDKADALTDDEEQTLQAELNRIRNASGMDVAVLLIDTLGGKSAQAYADDAYDYDGYRSDGILLLIAVQDREYHMTTTGRGIGTFTDRRLDRMESEFVPYLSSNDWSGAISEYAEWCDWYLFSAEDEEEGTDITLTVVLVPLIGVGLALVIVLGMKSQLKSVRPARAAQAYLVNGSFLLTQTSDRFLYSNVTRRPIPKDNGSSSTHRGSSGRSHGGSGGRF